MNTQNIKPHLHSLTLLLPLAALAAACSSPATPQTDAQAQLNYCHSQVLRTLTQLRGDSSAIDYSLMPRNIPDGDTAWTTRPAIPEEWCGGFWPGVLWYDYEATGDTAVLRQAELFTDRLGYLSRRPAYDHDLGFLVYCSYGNAYRLTHRAEYKRILLDTADTLATLYRPAVGTILSWPRRSSVYGGHNTIMDNMMNLELLFWATKNGGRKELRDIAVRHAETTMLHHFRPDHTCYHVAVYDSTDGHFIKGVTHQGYSDSSVWARGQAWAVYGYTMVYRETGDKKFLTFAQQVADAYLKRLPDDMVPYWDFDDPDIPAAPKDASAAAVVASALLELQGYTDPQTASRYREAACRMLASLSSDAYQSGAKCPAFLLHSTGNKPADSEIDASIIYADYYYIEALLRLKGLKKR